MKKLLIGLLALGTFSAFARPCTGEAKRQISELNKAIIAGQDYFRGYSEALEEVRSRLPEKERMVEILSTALVLKTTSNETNLDYRIKMIEIENNCTR